MRPPLFVGLALLLVACAAPATPPPATSAPATSSPASASAPGPAATAAPSALALDRIRVAYGAVSGVYLTTFMAKEAGLLTRYGLDAELQAIPSGPTLI